MSSDLDTPLGRTRKPKNRRPRRLNGRFVLAAGAVFAVFMAAGYTAWLPDRLRQTAELDVPAGEPATTPSADIAAHDNAGARSPTAAVAGRSDARIEETMTDDGAMVRTFRPGLRDGDGPLVIDGGAVGQDLRVAHLPEPQLLEESPFGALPIRGPDGERPMDAYARSWSGARGARIAIVVGGLGLSQTGTQYAIEQLPEEVTLAFSASGNSLTRWMQEARRGGHEIVLQVPFEPFNYPSVDPGPGTLTVGAGAETNIERLHRAMAEITNYTGIMNYMGGRFMADVDAFEPVMRDLARRGLLFLDDGTSAQSTAEMLAGAIGAPFAAAELVLDGARERGAILRELDTLERVAVRNGMAIGVASAFEVSVDAIADWVEEASARNIEVVGVAALADDPERR